MQLPWNYRRNSQGYSVLTFHFTNELDTAPRGSLLKGQATAFRHRLIILPAPVTMHWARSKETKTISHLPFGCHDILWIPRGSQEQRLRGQAVLWNSQDRVLVLSLKVVWPYLCSACLGQMWYRDHHSFPWKSLWKKSDLTPTKTRIDLGLSVTVVPQSGFSNRWWFYIIFVVIFSIETLISNPEMHCSWAQSKCWLCGL